ARQAGGPARAAAGPRDAGPGQVRRSQALRGGRAALRRPPGRLHTHPQDRPSAERFHRDGLPRAGLTSRLLLEYDGGPFMGWARQPGLRTVQGEVERALTTLLRAPVEVTAAGR